MQNKPIKINKQLAITAYGLQSVAGDKDFALFGAVAAMFSAASEDVVQEVPSPGGEGYDPALTAALPDMDDFEPDTRMLLSLQETIVSATNYLLEQELQDKKHLLLIVLPSSTYERSSFIDTEQWQEILSETLDEFTDLPIHFLTADNNVTKHLQSACVNIEHDKVESVIFAGIDSLIDQVTCGKLIDEKRLCSTMLSDGQIPGEAAACVVIQAVDPETYTPRAFLTGLSHIEEPNSGKADSTQLTALSQVIQNITQAAGDNPDKIDCVIRSSTTERAIVLEWYQTSKNLWPNKLNEQQRVAFQAGELATAPVLASRKLPEELNFGQTIGEIGAASVPLGLVLACARFDFEHPAVNNCLVIEANEFPFRGAIYLSNPAARVTQTRVKTAANR